MHSCLHLCFCVFVCFKYVVLILMYFSRLSEEQSLFEAVDNSGVKGLNSEVLTRLVAMYLKKGIIRENPTPYLGLFKVMLILVNMQEQMIDCSTT